MASTSSDRSWMYKRFVGGYLNEEFVVGVQKFLDFAEKHSLHKSGQKLKCPCDHKKCRNANYLEINEIKYHLYKNGFEENYYTWRYHGEVHIPLTSHYEFPVERVSEPVNREESTRNDLINMIEDAAGPDFDMDGDRFHDETPNAAAQSFYDLLDAGKKPLYPGCEKHTLLSFVSRLMNIKAENNISQKCYNQLSELIKGILPAGNLVPANFYESKKLLRGIGLPVEKIDCCKNNCMIFWGSELDSSLTECKICNEPRYKPIDQGNKKRRKTLVAHKKMYYFPLTPRLQRLSEKHPGSGPSKHFGGSKSSISYAKDIEKTEGRPAYAHEVFYKLHRKPDGSFSDPHSSQIDALYQSRLNEVTASNTPPEDIDRDAIYYDVAKTKKGRVFGTGLLGTSLASKCSSSTDGPSSSQNARWREELLGEMNTQMAEKVEEAVRSTQQRVEAEMRERMEADIRDRMEAEMSAKMEAEMRTRMDAEMEKMRELVRQLAHHPPPP
ncbi:hypothetical protein CASFOL_020072 [Castilleja foliolosa]|uniref:Transposase-associated domain-containing protein n=1 Tax=Castilleja foliolosa TaxID=1961234 RepID=A0ABD3CZT4_9LAMI